MSGNPRPSRLRRLASAQNGICPECGLALPSDLAEAEIDHIIPRSRGGPDLLWNRRLVHFGCNRSKHAKLTKEAAALADERGIALHEPTPWRRAAWKGWVPYCTGCWKHEDECTCAALPAPPERLPCVVTCES